jgi:hypothetical protein
MYWAILAAPLWIAPKAAHLPVFLEAATPFAEAALAFFRPRQQPGATDRANRSGGLSQEAVYSVRFIQRFDHWRTRRKVFPGREPAFMVAPAGIRAAKREESI